MLLSLVILWILLTHQLTVPQVLATRVLVTVLLLLVLVTYLKTAYTDCSVPMLPNLPFGEGTQHTWCDKCNNVKPRRAHHCSSCGRCILRMDHHCGFVNNCIGLQNHKMFILMLLYIPCAALAVFASSASYAAKVLELDSEHGSRLAPLPLQDILKDVPPSPPRLLPRRLPEASVFVL